MTVLNKHKNWSIKKYDRTSGTIGEFRIVDNGDFTCHFYYGV